MIIDKVLRPGEGGWQGWHGQDQAATKVIQSSDREESMEVHEVDVTGMGILLLADDDDDEDDEDDDEDDEEDHKMTIKPLLYASQF